MEGQQPALARSDGRRSARKKLQLLRRKDKPVSDGRWPIFADPISAVSQSKILAVDG